MVNNTNLAKTLSVVLGPQLWLPLLFLVVIFRSGLNNLQLFILLPTILLFQVIIPLAYLYLAPKIGLATAWDLPQRKERYLFLFTACISASIMLLLIYRFGTKLLFDLNLLLLVLLLFIFLITLYWKISLHTSLNTIGSILINFLFSWQLWLLYLTIPIIFWARYKLRKHSFWQLLAGVFISAISILVGLKLLGYE